MPTYLIHFVPLDTQVLSDIGKIVGDCEYVPTDAKELCNTILVTCYMGTENSSAETKARSAELAKQIGSYHHNIVIDLAVSAILTIFQQVTKLTPKFKVQGGSPRENLALQNIQVRVDLFPRFSALLDVNEICILNDILAGSFKNGDSLSVCPIDALGQRPTRWSPCARKQQCRRGASGVFY